MQITYKDIIRYFSLFLILLSFVIELNLLSFNDRTRILTFLYGLFTLFYLFMFIRFRIKFPPIILTIIFFLVYLTALASFSSDKVISYNYLAKFGFGVLSFITGYNFFFRGRDLRLIARGALLILATGLAITFYNNFRHAGISLYENDFYGQSLATTYNTFALLVTVVLTFSFFYSRREIIFSVILSFLTVFLLFLVFKRSPLLIIGMAGLSTLLFSAGLLKVNSKLRRNLLLLIMLVAAAYPLYRNVLNNNLMARKAAFESKIEDQPRYKENIAVLQQIAVDPVSLLIGTREVFNSRGSVIYRDRMLHTDYANILWGGGIIGFLVYFGIYVYLLRYYIRVRIKLKNDYQANSIAFAGIIIIQSYFICAMSQAWTSISVMSVIMIVCGAVYGNLKARQQIVSNNIKADQGVKAGEKKA